MHPGLFDLLIPLVYGCCVAFGFSRETERRVHLCVFVGLAVNRAWQSLGRCHLGFGVEQIQVTKSIVQLLLGGFFKDARGLFVSYGEGDVWCS